MLSEEWPPTIIFSTRATESLRSLITESGVTFKAIIHSHHLFFACGKNQTNPQAPLNFKLSRLP